ncbi:MAG: (2Fe-2S)-binding protein [Streptosporangiales bacterium]|nr:(2Fe-2S)-binding protein [Streptosporangiales bacterium]MBO0889585.1 (2Fe-2S)-binding protein [Acidothermales bacterium]
MTRLTSGGDRVDRSRPVTVTFDGADYPAYAGDTLASALLANGVRTVARGIYTGRPRGVFGIGAEEPNAFVQVESGTGEPMLPATLVEVYDGLRARSVAGKGRLSDVPDNARYDHKTAHCELVVVGGGMDGLRIAAEAAGRGERVVVCESSRVLAATLQEQDDVLLLNRTTVVGQYDHGYVVAVERRTDHLPDAPETVARQRLWHVRAGRVVDTTKGMEHPYAFPDNDRPGVMLAGAAAEYVTWYGVLPGRVAVVASGNDDALRAALVLADAGVALGAVLDTRPEVPAGLADGLRGLGVDVRTGHAVCGTDADSDGAVVAAHVAPVDEHGRGTAEPQLIRCDLVAVSRAWGPPPWSGQQVRTPGGASTTVGVPSVIRVPDGDGDAAGRTFVDLHRDATLADVERAVRVGMTHPEHVKRYTTIGTGADQGRTANPVMLGVLAELTGRPTAELEPTTSRPPAVPVSFALLAGRDRGRLADPERVTPMHPWHVAHGLPFEDVGQWRRPWYAPRGDEDMDEAVRRECRAVRTGVGTMDASTLGKIELQGRDVGAFLDRIYTNLFSTLKVGRIKYGVMCHADGMVFDDGTTARLSEDRWLMSTTTGNAAAVLDWLEEWLFTEWPELDVRCTSVTDHWATVAIAGPRSRDVVAALAPDLDLGAEAFPFMTFREATVAGLPARVFRISFSGELAYEVNVPAWYGLALWERVLEAGKPYGITVYGTETMHVLRAEKGFPIVGQDTDGTVTPQDLGMSWAVSKRKSFVGKRSYGREENLRDDRKQLVGLVADGDRVVPEGAQLVVAPGGVPPVPMAGHVTSGYWSTALEQPFALALLERGSERHGERLYAVDDGEAVAVTVTAPVCYDPEGARRDG